MARSSTTFLKGNTGTGRKGVPNKLTNDQRQIFDEAISHDDRVLIVKSVLARALGNNNKDAAPYCKLIFEYVFSRPKIGHEVTVLNMDEVFTSQVMDGVWREIQAEATERARHGSQAKDRPVLGIIDAKVVEAKGNGQAHNGRKKKTTGKKKARTG